MLYKTKPQKDGPAACTPPLRLCWCYDRAQPGGSKHPTALTPGDPHPKPAAVNSPPAVHAVTPIQCRSRNEEMPMAKKYTRQDLRDAAEKYKNWGKWGPNDEIGTLNFTTAEDIVAATRLVKKGKVI